jgi:hypothetical protein
VQHQYLAADISLGIGVVSLVTGLIVFFTRPEVPVRVGLTPFLSGPSPGVYGHF